MQTLSAIDHVVVHRTHNVRGRIMFSGTCTCGASSGQVPTSGMVAGWSIRHREEAAESDTTRGSTVTRKIAAVAVAAVGVMALASCDAARQCPPPPLVDANGVEYPAPKIAHVLCEPWADEGVRF